MQSRKKRAIGTAIAAVAGIGASLMGAQAAQAYSPWDCPNARVCVYENANGTGGRIILRADVAAVYNLKYYNFDGTQKNVNDQASSISWNGVNHCGTAYEHENARGESVNLGLDHRIYLSGGWNDRVSSIQTSYCPGA